MTSNECRQEAPFNIAGCRGIRVPGFSLQVDVAGCERYRVFRQGVLNGIHKERD
jgi:hypothetical protein